MKVFVFAK